MNVICAYGQKLTELNDKIKNKSVILFTISLIIIAVGQLFITSNSDPIDIVTDIANNTTSNMLTGTPDF